MTAISLALRSVVITPQRRQFRPSRKNAPEAGYEIVRGGPRGEAGPVGLRAGGRNCRSATPIWVLGAGVTTPASDKNL